MKNGKERKVSEGQGMAKPGHQRGVECKEKESDP